VPTPAFHFKAGRASALSGLISQTRLVRLQPLHPISGRVEEQQTRLLVREETAGAAPVSTASFKGLEVYKAHSWFAPSERRSVTVRVHHFKIPGEVKEPVGLLSRSSWCESMPGSQFQRPQGVTALHTPLVTAVVPGAIGRFATYADRLCVEYCAIAHGVPGAGTFFKTEHVRHRRGNGPENRCAPQRRPECDSLVLRHFSSLRSSTAEHSVDNRKTVERHHAEGPFQTERECVGRPLATCPVCVAEESQSGE
jgi:hypothetical protein